MVGKINWTEGMLLKAEHFHQQEAYFAGQLHERCRWLQNNYWGFENLTIEHSLLGNQCFAVSGCSGIFPDGTQFKAPLTIPLPEPINLSTNQPSVIYLFYRDNALHFSCDPNLAIAARSLMITLDNSTIDCARLNAWSEPPLIALAQQLIVQIRKTSSIPCSDHFSKNNLMRESKRLIHVQHHQIIHPESLYLLLLDIASALNIEIESYVHHQPTTSISSAFKLIFNRLNQLINQHALQIPVIHHEDNHWRFSLKSLAGRHSIGTFILAIEPNNGVIPPDFRCTQDLKIAGPLSIMDIRTRSLPGIPIKECIRAPLGIQTTPNTRYFIIEQDHPLWRDAHHEAELCVELMSMEIKCQLSLWQVMEHNNVL